MNRRDVIKSMVAAGALGAAQRVSLGARAESYPSKSIRVIVPWPAGGVADGSTRRLSALMEPLLGQQIVIENKPGASGMIGADYVAKAKPDGYTLLRGDMVTHAVTPYLFKNVPYDPVKDFAPISAQGQAPMLLVVHPGVEAKSVSELLALAKAKPGVLNSGAGNGTPQHLAGELLKQATGIDISHIPYKGEAPAVSDLIAGQIQVAFSFVSVAGPFVKSGKLRALSVTHRTRVPMLPDVPTMREAGWPELELSAWGGWFAPAGTPRPVIEKLNAAVVKGMDDPVMKEFSRNTGGESLTNTPDEFATFLKVEMKRWAEVARKAGVKIE